MSVKRIKYKSHVFYIITKRVNNKVTINIVTEQELLDYTSR